MVALRSSEAPPSPSRTSLSSAGSPGNVKRQEIAMARAGKGMGNQASTGHQCVGALNPRLPDESDFSPEMQGKNRLAGSNRVRSRNERQAVPGDTTQTQGVVEAFELMDPKRRAEQMRPRPRAAAAADRERKASGPVAASAAATPEKPGDQARTGTPGTGENTCPNCRGTGRIDGRPCSDCRGTGAIIEGIGGA
jgi:DnaJ-class molecular chaperone